jgi:acetolactate synthase-1/2/3 large subunit
VTRTGGQLLADQLVLHGATLAFCVPGESYLALLDALYDRSERVRVVTCRHEAAACNAAEAHGKLTGRPGLCLVTRGPGATHAATGVHTARQDSTPLVLLVGQVARGERGRESFQELDYAQVFGSLAKWAAEVDDPERIPELVARAFAIATSGRPGPVVLALPEDVLSAAAEAADARAYRAVEPVPDPAALAELRRRLEAAERPLVLVGGGPWDQVASDRLTAWAQASDLPVAATFRRQDAVDNRADCYVGDVGLGINPRLAARIAHADLLLAVGTRLAEIETQGYTLPPPPVAPMDLVHVHPDPGELGRVYQPTLPVLSGVRAFAAALEALGPVEGTRWAAWAAEARADYEAHLRPPPPPARGVDLAEVVAWLRDALPADAVVTNGAGNYTVWLHRFHQYRQVGTQLAPQSGAMGYGLPAALAAALTHPERVVVCLAGDGDLQMCAQELATAVQERLALVVLVVNNGTYGTIRMHQERRFPRRVIATDLVNPDFAALARAHGAHGERVERTDAFPAAFERARAAGGPALVELVTDPETLTPAATLSSIRAQADAAAGVRPVVAPVSRGAM